MIPCPSCKKDIDVNANPCPNCGRPNPISREMINSQFKRSVSDWKKSVNFKSDEDIERCYEKARMYVLEGKFQYALIYISSAVGSNYAKKSQKESMNELRKICEELNMSLQFNLWERRQTRNMYIFVTLVFVLMMFGLFYRKIV